MTQVWSATQIDSNLSGGGTTTVTMVGSSTYASAYGSEGFTSGLFYWETALTQSAGTNLNGFGIGNTQSAIGDWPGQTADTLGVYPYTPEVYWNNSLQYSVTISGNNVADRYGHALDLQHGTYWWSDITANPGVWYGATSTPGSPAANSGGFNLLQSSSTITSYPVVPAIELYNNGDVGHGYFGSSTWIGTPPTGFGPFDPSAIEGNDTLIFRIKWRKR